uniref:Uncharacterized protein n=1 Tax=Accipiter nisus TaxID=211598 RepID=A0A8B9N9B7_9AVES
ISAITLQENPCCDTNAEGYLADGLQNENLSAKAREQRDAILFDFQQVKASCHYLCLEFVLHLTVKKLCLGLCLYSSLHVGL